MHQDHSSSPLPLQVQAPQAHGLPSMCLPITSSSCAKRPVMAYRGPHGSADNVYFSPPVTWPLSQHAPLHVQAQTADEVTDQDLETQWDQ